MPKPRRGSFLGLSSSGFHRLIYHEWGPPRAERLLLCVHGLTRNGRDFDELAFAAAARGWRVVCPDVVGRGESEVLTDPAGYHFHQYLQDMTALLAHLHIAQVDWLGTSMGGLIGMLLAAQRKSPLRRLVLNDIGPYLPRIALEGIAAQLADRQSWPDLASAQADLKEAYRGFGPLMEEEWQRLIRRSLIQLPDGCWKRNFDPAIVHSFARSIEGDLNLWEVWDAVAQPVLVLRGALSELLTADIAAEMAARGPGARVAELPQTGHAPALMQQQEIDLILDWLESADGSP